LKNSFRNKIAASLGKKIPFVLSIILTADFTPEKNIYALNHLKFSTNLREKIK